MNPFKEKPMPLDKCVMNWNEIAGKPYNKNEVSPYTKTRIILMNGTEYEAVWFSHQFSRHCNDNSLRRELCTLRRTEQQQQKQLAALKPADETILETTIGYEQLAVDLTAYLAQNEKDKNVVKALDFALLEDFDHLYRYANLLDGQHNIHAERLVGGYTEIMPGRPTISHHRCPHDGIPKFTDFNTADLQTKLNVNIITAAEQQTMNYYMNVGAFYPTEEGRRLYTEIGMIEEQHVSRYGGLIDPNCTWLENLLMHEYCECYLYYSMFNDETDERIKKVFEQNFYFELAHLHHAAKLIKKYEGKTWQQVFPCAEFPAPLKLHENKEYVRGVLKNTVYQTAKKEGYCEVSKLPETAGFFEYQAKVNPTVGMVASHNVIENYIKEHGQDYRFEESENPVKELQNRKKDNTTVGRKRCAK